MKSDRKNNCLGFQQKALNYDLFGINLKLNVGGK